jgi:hypothetical protein
MDVVVVGPDDDEYVDDDYDYDGDDDSKTVASSVWAMKSPAQYPPRLRSRAMPRQRQRSVKRRLKKRRKLVEMDWT